MILEDLKHVGKKVMRKLLEWIGNAIRSIVRDVHEVIELRAPLAVNITEKVKDAIERHDSTIEYLLDRTATEKDNQAYDFIKSNLPALVREIAILDGLASENDSHEKAWAAYSNYILGKKKEGRAKEWANLAAKILLAIINKKFPFELAVMATQKAFHLIFGKK
jgi:hypothetical protein